MWPRYDAASIGLRLLLLSALLALPRTGLAADTSVVDKSDQAIDHFEHRAEVRRQNELRRIERILARKTGRGGIDAWYVIAFYDTARRVTPPQPIGYGAWRTYATLERVRATHYELVAGRAAAAQAIYDFLRQRPQAVHELDDTAYWNHTDTAKTWEFRTFRSASEAREFYSQVRGE